MTGVDARAPVRPETVASDRRIHVIDVRPREERESVLGYIPGSRHFPADLLRMDTGILEDVYPKDTPLAIVCQSGRRSAELCARLQAAGFRRARNLEGGMLAWSAAGLPVCAATPPDPRDVPAVPSIERFPRILAACFVASTAENALGDPMWEGRDPAELVRALVEEEQRGAPVPTPAVLERVVERLAEIARERGFPLDSIQVNVDRMTAALRRLAR